MYLSYQFLFLGSLKNVGLTQKDLWNFVILGNLTSCHLNIGLYLHLDGHFHWVLINFLPERRLIPYHASLILVNANWKPVWSFILLLFQNSSANFNFFKKSLKVCQITLCYGHSCLVTEKLNFISVCLARNTTE